MGDYKMWEQVGSGIAIHDFDRDGRMDAFFVQCSASNSVETCRLFLQSQPGKFHDATEGSGLARPGPGMGVAAADFNNDGWPDIALTEYGAVRLFQNRGAGKFAEVSARSGLLNPRWGTAVSFLDYDRDGWLDLVVVNYLDYHPTRRCKDQHGQPEFCGPQDFSGVATRLFHNLGAKSTNDLPSFRDVTVEAGLARAIGPGLGVFCADFDGDHWPDIFIADDGKPNRLFINQRNGTFSEEAAQRGIAYTGLGGTAGNMGIAVGDANQDGLFDVFVTHLTHEQHTLWIQSPRGLFEDRTAVAGLVNPSWRGTGFGAAFADFNSDGALDLAFVNGRVLRGPAPESTSAELKPLWKPYAQRNQVFLNNGAGRFADASANSLAFTGTPAVGRGLAMGDLDNDGAVDLLWVSAGGPARLSRNVSTPRGFWLTIRATLPQLGNRDAIGAEVTAIAGNQRWSRVLQPSGSYLSSHDPRLFFGLGSTSQIDRLLVLWPDGAQEEFPGGPANRTIELRRGEGRAL